MLSHIRRIAWAPDGQLEISGRSQNDVDNTPVLPNMLWLMPETERDWLCRAGDGISAMKRLAKYTSWEEATRSRTAAKGNACPRRTGLKSGRTSGEVY